MNTTENLVYHRQETPFDSARIDLPAFYRVLREIFPGEASFLFRRNLQTSPAFAPGFDVMGFESFESLRTQGGRTTVSGERGETVSERDPFTVLSERMAGRVRPRASSDPEFVGGAFGYFGFDSVRLLEPSLAADQTRGPNDFEAELFFFRKFVVFDHATGIVMLFADGDRDALDRLAAAFATARARIENADFRSRARASETLQPLSPAALASMLGFAGHQAGVAKLKEHIAAGDIFQAVLSERFEAPFTGDPIDLFSALCRANPAPYQYVLHSGPRTFLGCSPEMLLRIRGAEMETHPIAGTRPRGRDAEEESKRERQLRESEKENAEHLMLVDLARNDLSRVARAGSVRVREFSSLRKFGPVMHLVSTVVGERRPEVDAVQALAACFPAGTLSGAPKIRAIQLISEIEPKARGFYGGAVVLAGFSGDLDSCIAIRSISVADGVARVQAGGGIVAGSNAEMEYAEIEQKSRASRAALAKETAK